MTDFAGGQLSKVVPAHRRTVRFRWLKRDFRVMDQDYRRVRAKMNNPFDTCRWCSHKLADGEMMALAQPEKGGNWLLCQACAGLLTPVNGSALSKGDER